MKTALSLLTLFLFSQLGAAGDALKWKSLPAIPDERGFAGPFAGAIEGNLIVTGGANFPEAPPWEGGKKVWHDGIFILKKNAKQWIVSEIKLPKVTAYGLSFSIPSRDSIVMVGGSDSNNEPTNSAFELKLENGKPHFLTLPNLPIPLAEASGAALETTVYVFSGRSVKGIVKQAFRIELNTTVPAWEEIPWPVGARGRVHSTAGVLGGKLFLFAGRDAMSESAPAYSKDRLTGEKLDFLRDCYQLDPKSLKWKRLADLPIGLSAAPMNAVPAGDSQLMMLGGVGAEFIRDQIAARPEINGQGTEHPGFSRTIRAYNAKPDTWTEVGVVPETFAPPVTVPVVPMRDGFFVIPSGEIKPGIRTTQVLAVRCTPTKGEAKK